MPELISRPGVVISTDEATTVAASLSRRPACPAGVWRVTTNRWELWKGPAPDPTRLATIDIAHNVPYPHAATLTRVAVTEDATLAGLDTESICDMALHAAGKRMADCPRHLASEPPVFTGRRHTNRSEWVAEAAVHTSGDAPAGSAGGHSEPDSAGNGASGPEPGNVAVPAQGNTVPAGSDAAQPAHEGPAVPVPDGRQDPESGRLDNREDRELRRLHYLATFGGLSGGLAERYAELRRRDRRSVIRDPHDDDLVVLPSPQEESDDMEPVTGAS